MDAPKIADRRPAVLELEAGSYHWCSCGHSNKQPFCDGSHKGTGLNSISYEAAATETKYFCSCKHTRKQPFCDGTHNGL